MQKEGLSLFGFMEEQIALNYLATRCVLPDKSLATLHQLWEDAKTKLGLPIPNAGYPEIQDIPKNYKSYLQGVVNKNPRYKDTVGNLSASFKLVEIDPLLSYQFHVELERIVNPFDTSTNTSSMGKLLEICLPQKVDEVPRGYEFHQDHSVLIKVSDVNIDVLAKGPIGGNPDQKLNALGVLYGLKSPLVQVIRYNGRCFLRNGFHRAYILKQAGVSHIPCVLLEGNSAQDIGPIDGQIAFSLELLESQNPPTCVHFSECRAYPVTLKSISRIIHVNWSVYNLLDEE